MKGKEYDSFWTPSLVDGNIILGNIPSYQNYDYFCFLPNKYNLSIKYPNQLIQEFTDKFNDVIDGFELCYKIEDKFNYLNSLHELTKKDQSNFINDVHERINKMEELINNSLIPISDFVKSVKISEYTKQLIDHHVNTLNEINKSKDR